MSYISILVNFIVYIIVSILLNKFYKTEYKKSTVLAFIPLIHIYVIGKLLSGKTLGIILVILGIFTFNARFSIYLGETKITIGLGSIFWIILLIFIIVLFVKCKKNNKKYLLERYIFKQKNHNGCMLKILESLGGEELNYNWLVTDMDTYFTDEEYLFLSTRDLLELIEKNNDPQWIWGVFTAIPKKYSKKDVFKYEFPTITDNKDIWESPVIQHLLGDIEIICYDSSFNTIVSKDEKYIDMLRKPFPSIKEDN